MPLPPLKSLLSSARAAADRYVTEPIIAAAQAMPSPRPHTPRQPYCGVEVNGTDNTVIRVFDPDMTIAQLNERRQHYIDQHQDQLRFEIMSTNDAQQLRAGDIFHLRRLEIMEAQQARANHILRHGY
jgi:hypothetical protein